MERELWKLLYQLARTCEEFHWSRVDIFFRFDDRGCLLLGSDPRSTSGLGLRTRQLAEKVAKNVEAPAFSIDAEPPAANHRGAALAGGDGRPAAAHAHARLGLGRRWQAAAGRRLQQRSGREMGIRRRR